MNSMLRMTPRMKFIHGFVEYIHDHGMTELLHEELEAKEKRRQARAKKLAACKKRIV